MTHYERFLTTAAIDSVLLDVATQIELSPADRRVAENRYRRLHEHLHRPSSPIAPYLMDGEHLIYAQGSMATSTTILSGIDDDRFDVDAIVEMNVPLGWTEHQALDLLEQSLQGFPGVVKIVRCTRCIQLQFPFMHMDVTIMDRGARNPIARAGSILHAPDNGASSRVPSNPWGFTGWFRASVGIGQSTFAEELAKRRKTYGKSRIKALDAHELALAKAEQVDLPPMIPSALDAQEAVALKLLKRHIYKRYERLVQKQPPSIYLAKRTGMTGHVREGLTAQLIALAESIAAIMRGHLADGTRPDELNPTYPQDRINDRWPSQRDEGRREMDVLAGVLETFSAKLRRLARAPLSEVVDGMAELFGERVGAELKTILATRYDTRAGAPANLVQSASGNVKAPAIVTSTHGLHAVPRHNFHPGVAPDAASRVALPGPRRSPRAQIEAMQKIWPGFSGHHFGDGMIAWRGCLQPQAQPYDVEIYWSPKLLDRPYVVVNSPEIAPCPGSTFKDIPHLMFCDSEPTRSGLCLFDPDGREWTPVDLIAETTVYWTAEWLTYYELWHLTGEWLAPGVGYASAGARELAELQQLACAGGLSAKGAHHGHG